MRVKICGLSEPETLQATIDAGASYVGFVFFAKSPRNATIETAKQLAQSIPAGVCKTALVVNPTDSELDNLLKEVPIDMIQLHGNEPVERVLDVKSRYGLPVMKAVGVSTADDLQKIDAYARVADQLLIDAKPSGDADLPGGNGLSFDWRLIAGRRWALPWMLAGGLTPNNITEAIRLTGATQVDVSSGVEGAVGVKDKQLISDFIRAANGDA